MKLELKENMYIRTKDGHIDKILLVEYAEEKRQQYPNHPSKKYWRDKILLLKAGYWRTTQNIIKASHNIIDILQVGDVITTNNLCGEITKIDIENNKIWIACCDYETCSAEDIKSIVTKEQMEQMAYKVEE